jgi:hypothetical protein
MYNSGSGFKDISPKDYNKYGITSAGPQRFCMDKSSNRAYFVYTTGQIYLVTINLGVPSVPLQYYPFENSVNVDVKPQIKWYKSPEADNYDLHVSDKADFSNLVTSKTGLADTLVYVDNLSGSRVYYWRIRSKGAGGSSQWSSPWAFTTVSPVGIDDLDGRSDIIVYPNPVDDMLFIEGIESEFYTVSIYSMDGRLLIQIGEPGIRQIDVSRLPKGNYFVEISGPPVRQVRMIIKR